MLFEDPAITFVKQNNSSAGSSSFCERREQRKSNHRIKICSDMFFLHTFSCAKKKYGPPPARRNSSSRASGKPLSVKQITWAAV
jgi:hypothetical protein